MTSRYKVALLETEEGFSVSCPGLPGCWSARIHKKLDEYYISEGANDPVRIFYPRFSPWNRRLMAN